jgi:hypothetical protein
MAGAARSRYVSRNRYLEPLASGVRADQSETLRPDAQMGDAGSPGDAASEEMAPVPAQQDTPAEETVPPPAQPNARRPPRIVRRVLEEIDQYGTHTASLGGLQLII